MAALPETRLTDGNEVLEMGIRDMTEVDMKTSSYIKPFGKPLTQKEHENFSGLFLYRCFGVDRELIKGGLSIYMIEFSPPTGKTNAPSIKAQQDPVVKFFIGKDNIIVRRCVDKNGKFFLVFVNKDKLKG